MNKASTDLPKDEISLPFVLERTGQCLAHLSARILTLERRVLDSCSETDAALPDPETLQSFDFLNQATDDIASMLARLAEAVSPSSEVSRIDVIDTMKLQELRTAISFLDSDRLEEMAAFSDKKIEIF